MKLRLPLLLLAVSVVGNPGTRAQTVPPLDPKGQVRQISFSATPVDQVLEEYAGLVGRTLIKAPNVTPITITLSTPKGQLLTPSEYLLAIESVLALNNITLVPQGDKFLKVLPADAAIKENLEIRTRSPAAAFGPTDNMVSQVVEVKHLEPAELQPLVQEFLHPYAKIQLLERNNAVLITDTASNVQRVIDILKYIDVSIESKEEPRIYQLKHAKAADVAARLNDLIAESQQDSQRRANRPPVSASGTTVPSATPATPRPTSTTPTSPNIIRAPVPGGSSSSSATPASGADAAAQGLVQGKVKIVSDERTNILIIISRPDNFAFFDDMIEVLDRQVEPEMSVEVIRLEFSEADEMSGILSDLIGSSSGGSRRTSSSSSGASFRNSSSTDRSSSTSRSSGNDSRNQTIRDFINRSTPESTTPARAASTTGAAAGDLANVANISENTRIISDPRTNAILILGRKEDIAILKQVVAQLDVMLAQVMLEALILEVNLNDNLSFGVDWLQRSMQAVRQNTQGPRGGITVAEPIFAFGGGQNFGTGVIQDAAQVTRSTALNPGALSYFGTFTDLNLDVVISLAAGDSDARVLSAPIIITTDNTEAAINVGERRPIPTTTSAVGIGGSDRTTVEYENIGIELQVKPRISPNRVVSLEVQQKVDNVGGTVTIDGNEVPIITTRQLDAAITMTNKTTLVLGGLVSEDRRDSHSKVPLLGDIPLIGNLFRSTRKVNNRTELLVLITPHVIMSVEDAISETERLHRSTKMQSTAAALGRWSEHSLAEQEVGGRAVPLRRYRNHVEDLRSAREQQARAEAAADPSPRRPSSVSIRIPPVEAPHPVEPLPSSRQESAPPPSAPPAEPAPVEPPPGTPAPAEPPAGQAGTRRLIPAPGRNAFRAEPVVAARVTVVEEGEEIAAPPLR
jgi:type II secretion system protein D